jgi:hypothetical protein
VPRPDRRHRRRRPAPLHHPPIRPDPPARGTRCSGTPQRCRTHLRCTRRRTPVPRGSRRPPRRRRTRWNPSRRRLRR